MPLFDRLRNFADKVLNRTPKEAAPSIEPEITSAWARATQPARPSLFERVKRGVQNLFGGNRTETAPTRRAPIEPPEPQTHIPRHFKPADEAKRKKEIFRFRRNSQEEGNAFYRLTQSIWDDPSIPASKRDEAIREYFEERYGLEDMNEIYDFVLKRNKEAIERYRNAPNALKYEALKNIKVTDAEL